MLFNLAALHTQIGSKQDRQLNSDAADGAVDNFLRAAGTLRYVGEHFTHPPSFDLDPVTLDALTALLLVSHFCRRVLTKTIIIIMIILSISFFSYSYVILAKISMVSRHMTRSTTSVFKPRR